MSEGRKARRTSAPTSRTAGPSREPPARRALLSVADKEGLGAFAAALVTLGFEIVSTGGNPATFKVTDFSVTTSRR